MWSFLATIFGRKDYSGTGSLHVRDRVSVSEDRVADVVVTLPRRRDDVLDWVPPPVRKMPPRAHAEALVALFQAEGRTGPVPHYEITASYPELCWMHGFRQLSERCILQALGQVCAKVRTMVDQGQGRVGKVQCYVIPAPAWASGDTTNVLPYRNKRPAKEPIQAQSARSGTRAHKRIASNPQLQGQGKGERYSADISHAVAY